MKISIIIPVRNDRRIVNTIKGILLQKNIRDFEIIVVDASNGSLDDVKKMFENKIRWVKYKNINNARKRTTVAQINLGVEKAKGDFIVYIDADCIPATDWLYELTKPLIYENEYFVGGAVKSLNKKTHRDEQWDNLTKHKYVNCCANMNSAVRRELLEKVGKYDAIKFNYGWDVDYCWRAINAGYRIKYVPTAVIYHDWGSAKSELKRSYRYGEARARLYKKHPDKIKDILSEDPMAILYPLIILSLSIIMVFPYYSLIFPILILNNLNRGNPFIIVLSHFAYGIGVIKGAATLVR